MNKVRRKSSSHNRPKEMSVLSMRVDQFKMNSEERLIFQKMRDLFKQLRGLSHEERKDSLLTLSLIMNSIYKTNEETALIPHIEKTLVSLKNKKVEYEGYINSARYDLCREVVLYDFKINGEKIPFLLSGQLFLIPSFDIYQSYVSKNTSMDMILIEDELGLQKFYIFGKGILKYKKGEELIIDISRQNELSLV